jgi:N-methylhydantoinase B/oxoprolinase/acetone carboxylase alpha subunit
MRLTVALAITVAGSELQFDFTGTSPASRGPMNISDATTRSLCFVALKHIFPDVPVNGGAFRPTQFTIPKGCILSAAYPSAVGGTTDVTQRVVDVVFGAMSQLIPDKAPAAFFGTIGVVAISGTHPRSGSYFVGVFPYPGGYGASKASDGLINGTPPQSMANFMSLEMSDHRFPIRFNSYSVRDDSGGAGWHRQPMLVGVGRIEHAMQMDDDIFHRRIVDGALGIGTPGGLGGGIIGEDADHVELVGFDEIKGLRIADAAAEDEMKLAHGRRFSRMALRTPVVKIRRLARKAVSAAIEPTVAIRGLACERPLRRTPDVLINLLELNSGNDA